METILYVDASTESEAYRLKLSGINRYAQTRKWNVQTIYYSPHKEPPIAKLIAEIRPSGVIVESCEDRHHFDRRLFGRVPVVYLDANARLYGKNTPMVLHKPDEAADLAVREFQMLGCRHVAYVGWFGQVFWSAMREKAFVQAATVGGLTCDVFRSTYGMSRQIEYERDLLKWLAGQPVGLGVFAANDRIASCVLAACRRLELRVPSEVYVLGVDNDVTRCESESPRMSSIQLDFERAGYLACELLDSMIYGHASKKRQVAFGALGIIRRESTRAYPRMDAKILSAVRFIREKACDGISVSDVVAVIGGSRRHAEIRFRETTGKTILEEIQSVKFEKVYYYLSHTNKPIEAIANFCGYNSSDSLRRMFFKRTGISMREWRVQNHL